MAYQEMTRVFQNSEQKGAARLIMLAIAEHADTDGFAYPSAERLANYANLSTRHTERVIAQLKDTPELFVMAGGGRWKSNRYVVLVGCDLDEAIRRVQCAYKKGQGTEISKAHARMILVVNKGVEIMSDVDQMSEYSSEETPTSDTETPTSGVGNTDILSKETPTSDPITPTSDTETPTSDTETPTSDPITPTPESDEPIEPSLTGQSVEPSSVEPSDFFIEPPDLNREREPEEPSKILSLVGYSVFEKKFFEITGRNPKLELHQQEVNPLAVELWGEGYRVEDLERTALLCSGWMKIPPHPKQVVQYIAAAKSTISKKKSTSQYGSDKGNYGMFYDKDVECEDVAEVGD
jgi:hypothetical protein